MASSRRQNNSAQKKQQAARTRDFEQILEHLTSIQGHLDQADSSVTAAADSQTATSDQADQILESLGRQNLSLQTLAEGLQSMQAAIVEDVLAGLSGTTLPSNAPLDQTALQPSYDDRESVELLPAEPEPVESAAPVSGAPVQQSWETIRQALLNSEAGLEPSAESTSAEVPETIDEPEPHEEPSGCTGRCRDAEELLDLEPVEFQIPEPFDSDRIEDDEVRAAFQEREEILRMLSARLRQRLRVVSPVSIDQLRDFGSGMPDDLRQHVESSLAKLDDKLRLTELELSLERARMARQMTQLEDSHRFLENKARQLGFTVLEDGSLQADDSHNDSSRSERRWTRVLGLGR